MYKRWGGCTTIHKLFHIFAPKTQLKYVSVMARPIKGTPILKGKDVECFKYNTPMPSCSTRAREAPETL